MPSGRKKVAVPPGASSTLNPPSCTARWWNRHYSDSWITPNELESGRPFTVPSQPLTAHTGELFDLREFTAGRFALPHTDWFD